MGFMEVMDSNFVTLRIKRELVSLQYPFFMALKSTFKKIAFFLGLGIIKGEKRKSSDLPIELAEEDRNTINLASQFTMTSNSRLAALITATRYIVNNRIDGAFVECGVWKGGSVLAMAETLRLMGIEDRYIYLFDTFRGMTPAGSLDYTNFGGQLASELMEKEKKIAESIWAIAGLDEVKQNLTLSKYDFSKYIFVIGAVEETLKSSKPSKICLLRLDTDWYESTRIELETLYPLLEIGGVLIIDDYGYWNGARRAVDEYFEKMSLKPYLHVVDETCRLIIKTK